MCLEVIVYGSILRYNAPVQVVHLYLIQSINQGCVFLFHCNVSTHCYSLYTAICASQTWDIEHFTHKVRQGYIDLPLKFVHRCVLPTGSLHAVILLILCR